MFATQLSMNMKLTYHMHKLMQNWGWSKRAEKGIKCARIECSESVSPCRLDQKCIRIMLFVKLAVFVRMKSNQTLSPHLWFPHLNPQHSYFYKQQWQNGDVSCHISWVAASWGKRASVRPAQATPQILIMIMSKGLTRAWGLQLASPY